MNELIAYYNLEPFGELREEFRHGKLMSLIANINRNIKKRSKPFEAIDFMDFITESEKETVIEPPEVLSSRIAREIFGM